MIENQFQNKIGILCSDNGTKYSNEGLEKILKEKGIQHQSTCRDTPEQNGIVEWKNEHLLEVARAIIFSANVPKYLWNEKFQWRIGNFLKEKGIQHQST